MGGAVQEKHGPGKPGEQRRSVCTFDKIRTSLGWEPGTIVEHGLQATLEYFRHKILT